MPGLTIANVGFLGGSFVIYTTPTYVGGYTIGLPTTGTPTNVVLTSLSGGTNFAPSIGDLVILAFAQTTDNVDANISGTGYTEIIDLYANDTIDTNLYVGYKYLTSTDTRIAVGNVSSNSTASSYAVQVWRNAGISTFTNTTTVTVTNSAHARLNNAITDLPNSVVVGIAAGGNSSSTGYTNSLLTSVISSRGDNTSGGYDSIIGMGYIIASTPGTVVLGTFTSSATDTSSSAISVTLVIPPA